MMKLALMLADGFEEIEAIGTVDILRRGGVEVVTAAIGETLSVTGAHGIVVTADAFVDDLDAASLDAIALPGGMGGMKRLRADRRVAALARELLASGKIVSAICASPLALSAAGVLEGRRATCYPGLEGELRCGAYVADETVVEDGNVITSQGPGTTFDFALALLARLAGEDAAAQVASGMLL